MRAKTTYASAAALPERIGFATNNGEGLFTAPDGRVWDYRPFGQSLAARRGRVRKNFLRVNAWKVRAGVWSKKELRANARLHARLNVTTEDTYGAKYVFRSPKGVTLIGWNRG